MDERNSKSDLIMRKFQPVSDEGSVEQTSGDDATADSAAAESGEGVATKAVDPREELSQSLGQLLGRMRSNQTGWLARFGYSYAERRFGDILDKCVKLQKELPEVVDDTEAMLDFRTRVYDLEATYNRLRFRLVLIPSFLVISAAIVGMGAVVIHSGLSDYIQDKLEIRRVMRYIFLAIAGAALYMLTSVMSRQSSSERDGHTVSSGVILVRILIAIVVPTIIVMLTFEKGGGALKLGQLWKSPGVWAFLCGYSSKIVIMALNKVVEKVSKMIESL